MIHAQPPADDAHGARVGGILNEYFDRRSRGDGVSVDDLLAAHPDLADELRAGLDVLGDLGVSPSRIDSLIRSGVLTKSSEAEFPAELGPYRIVGALGSGGMGIVLEAREPRLDRTVAIKILKPELADNAGLRLRFVREAKSAAALKHAHIVGIHAVGESAGVPYIVMEHVSGPTLADVIRGDERLSTEFIRSVLGQLLEALSAAHEAGLIHRDVKPSNILLAHMPAARQDQRIQGFKDQSDVAAGSPGILESSNSRILPTIKLADFGLARMQDSQTQLTMTQAVLGTPEYMSPEQARGDADIDERADLYSAGVVLYEMLTGRTPFRADTPSATIHRILHEEPRAPRELEKAADPVLASLALRMMAKRREDRFEGAGEARGSLVANERVVSPATRRRFRCAAVWCVMIAGLFSVGMLLWQRSALDAVDVRIDPELNHVIQIRYGEEASWRVFHRFPAGVHLRDVATVDLDGDGRMAVVATLVPFDGYHPNVVAFRASGDTGEELWSRYIGNEDDFRWPDCSPGSPWAGLELAVGELDGTPGEELVVSVHDGLEYPTRVSVVDASTGEVASTFWHMGHTRVLIQPDFFGPDRGAIIGWGQNNKLDGFEEPIEGDGKPFTEHDCVASMFILDPMSMAGLGPPSSRRVPQHAVARPYAYAYLDQPTPSAIERDDSGALVARGFQPAYVWRVASQASTAMDASEPWLRVSIKRHGEDQADGATLTVDRHLTIRQAVVGDAEKELTDERAWRGVWRVIIRDGQYVDDQATASPTSAGGVGARS